VVVEEATTLAEVSTKVELMDLPTVPKTVNSTRPRPTAGRTAMIAPQNTTAVLASAKSRDIWTRRLETIRWEDPSKIKNSPNGPEAVGDYKQIILKN